MRKYTSIVEAVMRSVELDQKREEAFGETPRILMSDTYRMFLSWTYHGKILKEY